MAVNPGSPNAVALVDASGNVAQNLAAGADAVANTSGGAIHYNLPMVFNGATWDRARTPNVFKVQSAVVITSETTVWTPTTGKKFRLMGFMLTQGVATGAVTFKDNTGGTAIFVLPANTVGVQNTITFGNGILSAAVNNVLTATGASTETITGTIFGTEE